MTPSTYNDVLVSNIRAARNRIGIDHATAADRMSALGFDWTRQIMSKVEHGGRKVAAEEVPALAYALQTTISRLMAPLEEDKVVQFRPGTLPIPVESVRLSAVGQIVHGAFRWDGDKPVFLEHPAEVRDVTTRMAEGKWPPGSGD